MDQNTKKTRILPIFYSVLSPIVSLIILVLGNGLFMTYVTVRLKLAGYSSGIVGIITASYYAGILLGCVRAEKYISRIGHIRSFASFASLTAVIILLQGLFINSWYWGVLRFLSGFSMAGLFVTIESWLLVKSTTETRGKILSIYMTAFYAAQALGQFLLDVSDPLSLIPFVITAILTSLSIIPVSMTRTLAPSIEEPSFLSIFKLLKITPLGVTGCTLSGVLLGTIYGLVPIYAQEIEMNVSQIAQLMGIIIFGGFVLQWPLGSLSDHFDRRKVIMICAIIATVLAILIAFLGNVIPILLLALSCIFGGFTFTLYPLSISHACDSVEQKDLIAATGGLLLAYGVGAIVGPLLAPLAMLFLGARGLFFFFALVTLILALFSLWRISIKPPIPEEEKLPYTNIPRTTPMASELDPRGDEESQPNENKQDKQDKPHEKQMK